MRFAVNLSQATVVCLAGGDRRVEKARDVLLEEIARRTGLRLPVAERMPRGGRAAIVVGVRAALGDLAAPVDALPEPGAEGFRLLSAAGRSPRLIVAGADARGVLYGVGRLLRTLSLRPGDIVLETPLRLSTAPRFPLRGHQLGYRPLNNTYDAWTPEQYDQYIRELALFGANAIEFVAPRTDDPQRTAPHMKCEPLAMLAACSRICDDYGLDVWLWYPNMEQDYSAPDVLARALAEREEVLRAMPRLDALFIPGGDPGGLEIPALFDWCARVGALLQRHHPRAGVWLSTQAFKAERAWVDGFYERVREEPSWLRGIVFAPWERDSIADLRARIPARYPIRHYPDIAHTFLCQYPVPHWDQAFAVVEGRECIDPRPEAMKRIHNLACAHAAGSLTYSEGVNDDVNKFVWADQDWDPEQPVEATLRDYARLFLGPDCVEEVVAGLLALERNWEGALAENAGVEETLALWQGLEARQPGLLRHWRFQQGLLRACLDAALRRRLLRERDLERRARAALQAGGDLAALDAARRILEEAAPAAAADGLRQRCLELADSLWRDIGAQLTTTRHCGQRTYRGAFMDNIDLPLNDAAWLLESFARIRQIESAAARRQAIADLVGRTDPGPGGRYDCFGDPASWARVQPGLGWERDPGHLATPLRAFWPGPLPWAWRTSLTAYYDLLIVVSYGGLDGEAAYKLRVTYVSGPWPHHVRLRANEQWEVHQELAVEKGQCLTREYDLPRAATRGGELRLAWRTRDGELGARIAELWLLRREH